MARRNAQAEKAQRRQKRQQQKVAVQDGTLDRWLLEARTELERTEEIIEDSLKLAGIKISRLSPDEAKGLLWHFLNPGSSQSPAPYHNHCLLREQREGKVAPIDGRVFTWGGRPMTEGWKRAWATACRKAGLEGLWFHDLRHTFVTRKVKERWDYKRIMAITGHKTFATFMKYNNPREEDLKKVVANPSQPWQDRDNSVAKLLANGRKPQ